MLRTLAALCLFMQSFKDNEEDVREEYLKLIFGVLAGLGCAPILQ